MHLELHCFEGEILFDSYVFSVFLLGNLGALLGSFANVIIYRWPLGLSVVKPRSFCPECKAQVAWYDNVPIFSWLILKAKCRYCSVKISWRYPLTELLCAVSFALVFHFYGWSWLTLEYCIFLFGLITVSMIDIDHFLLPDVFTLSGIALGLVGAAINPERMFLPSLFGVLLGGGFLWLIAYTYYAFKKVEGMGGGDIKLLAWIGAILGWKAIPFVILTSSILGSVIGLGFHAKKGNKLSSPIPFGPYLALGAVVYLFGGEPLSDWYFSLFFP